MNWLDIRIASHKHCGTRMKYVLLIVCLCVSWRTLPLKSKEIKHITFTVDRVCRIFLCSYASTFVKALSSPGFYWSHLATFKHLSGSNVLFLLPSISMSLCPGYRFRSLICILQSNSVRPLSLECSPTISDQFPEILVICLVCCRTFLSIHCLSQFKRINNSHKILISDMLTRAKMLNSSLP